MAIFRNNSAYQSWQAPARHRALRYVAAPSMGRLERFAALPFPKNRGFFGTPLAFCTEFFSKSCTFSVLRSFAGADFRLIAAKPQRTLTGSRGF